MQAQALNTETRTAIRFTSGGEYAEKVSPTGRVTYYWCGHKISQGEAKRLKAIKAIH